MDMESYEGFTPGLSEEAADGEERHLEKTVRIFPHKMHGEGHYLALVKKGEGVPLLKEKVGEKRGKEQKLPDELKEFLQKIKIDLSGGRLDIRGEKVYYMPEGIPDLKGVRFLRTGLLLGELKKNRFEPSQALAMCLSKEDYPFTLDLPAKDERVIRYLKGETIDLDDVVSSKEKGWYLFCVDGYPLGWGKLAEGTLKNKYLPGWRWH